MEVPTHMTQTTECPAVSFSLQEQEYSADPLAGRILQAVTDTDTNSVSAVTTLLGKELLDLDISKDGVTNVSDYMWAHDSDSMTTLSLQAIQHLLPANIDCYPASRQYMLNSFNESGLRPLAHLAISLVGELQAGCEPSEPEVKRLLGLQLSCAALLNEPKPKQNLDDLTRRELERNSANLDALERIAAREGVTLDARRLMKIQPAVFEMLTTNDPVTTRDVNYRKRLNAKLGAARSLQAPEQPDPNKLLSRYGNYIDFIEATATTKRAGYASTFGFLHRVRTDTSGNPYIVEYPHTMFDNDILQIDHSIAGMLQDFEEQFNRTHDMLHNALPVYADHFMIHHPSAPITLGGYLPDYAAFGKGLRADKSSYELGLAILHRQIMEERFQEDPLLLEHHISTVRDILDGLTDLQDRGECPDEVIDHVSFVILSAAMNLIPFNAAAFKPLLDQYDRLKLPTLTVRPRDVYNLLVQQQVVTVENESGEANGHELSQDQRISDLCKQIDDETAIERLQAINFDYEQGEQGAEHIVNALREMGIEPVDMTDPLTLAGRDRLRWIGITASSRRLKGFNEKIHGLQAVRYREEESSQFEEVTPVKLLSRFYEHFQQNAEEYDARIQFRSASNVTLQHFKQLVFNPANDFSRLAAQIAPALQAIIDTYMCAIIEDTYEPTAQTDRLQLEEFIKYLNDNEHPDTAAQLRQCLQAYDSLEQQARNAATRNGQTYYEARQKLTRKLMSLDG